jgi:hypothetical protein
VKAKRSENAVKFFRFKTKKISFLASKRNTGNPKRNGSEGNEKKQSERSLDRKNVEIKKCPVFCLSVKT